MTSRPADPNVHQPRQSGARAQNWMVNWGKSSPPNRGTVEFVALHLDHPRDITLYLGQPATQMFLYPQTFGWNISVGSGGTSFNVVLGTPYVGDVSVRGNVLHFVCDELFVRAETGPVDLTLPGSDQVRFAAQAGLGRPSEFTRMSARTLQANGDAEMGWDLSPWATHARLDVFSTDPASTTSTAGFFVRQQVRTAGGTAFVTNAQPLAAYASGKGMALHPWANSLVLTTQGGGGAAEVFEGCLTETFTY